MILPDENTCAKYGPCKELLGRIRGARIALNTEIFISLLSNEGAFSGILDCFDHDNFNEGKPPGSQLDMV